MLFRNDSKQEIPAFSIGNEEKVIGSYMAVDAGVPIRKERRAMVEKFVGPIKPGDVLAGRIEGVGEIALTIGSA